MTQEFARFVSRIDKQVQEDIIDRLNRLDSGLVRLGSSGHEFGLVQNLASLVPAGQTSGRPVWEVDAGSAELRELAKAAFYGMADRLIEVAATGGHPNG